MFSRIPNLQISIEVFFLVFNGKKRFVDSEFVKTCHNHVNTLKFLKNEQTRIFFRIPKNVPNH